MKHVDRMVTPIDAEQQNIEMSERLTSEQEAIIRKVAVLLPTWKIAMLLREVDALRSENEVLHEVLRLVHRIASERGSSDLQIHLFDRLGLIQEKTEAFLG